MPRRGRTGGRRSMCAMPASSELRMSASAARERALVLRAQLDHTLARADALIAQSWASAGNLRVLQRLSGQVVNLNRAMESRSTIEQAVGIVIAGTGKSPEDSFRLLVQMSQR